MRLTTKRTVRMIKLERLLRCSVGTSKVEELGTRLALESRGGRRGEVEESQRIKTTRRKVIMLVKDKLKDAKEDMKLGKIQFMKSKKRLWKVVDWRSREGIEVRKVLRGEMLMEWE